MASPPTSKSWSEHEHPVGAAVISGSTDPIAVGRVTRAHGVRGEVSVLVLSEVEGRFEPGSALRLESGRELHVESSRPDRGRVLVKFSEVHDRTEAEQLHSAYLFVSSHEVPDLPPGAWWPHQLVGCVVHTDAGRTLGQIEEVVQGPANDIWVARSGPEEVLIPALRDIVVDVDVEQKRVLVRDVPGLTSP